jgi:hypothetical protein
MAVSTSSNLGLTGTAKNKNLRNAVGTPRDGQSAETAARSAKELLQSGYNTSGIYWINPYGVYNDVAIQVYCDQTYDGGGWMMAFAYQKSQNIVAEVSSYYTSPQAASTGTGSALANIARPHDPAVSFCLSDNFWRMSGSNRLGNGEIREEYSISGGTWPNNTNRIVSYHGGRTSGGVGGNYLSETLMSSARNVLGYNGRGATSYRFMGQVSRGGYTSNTIGYETPYTGGGSNTVIGISVDATTLNFDRNLAAGTNNASAAGISWMAIGSGYSGILGSSTNGGSGDGTRWGLVFIR